MKIKSLAIVATIVLVGFFQTTTALAQAAKKGLGEKRFYVFFAQGSSEVPASQKKTIAEVKKYLSENPELSPFFYGYRSQVSWAGEKKAAGWSRSRDGGLLIESVESVARAIGIDRVEKVGLSTQPNKAWFESMCQKGDTPFVMVIVKECPDRRQDRQIRSLQSGQEKLEKKVNEQGEIIHQNVENLAQLSEQANETQQTADGAYALAKSANDLAGNNASDFKILRQDFENYKKTQKAPQQFRTLRAGVGGMSVVYDDIKPMVVPSVRLEANLSNKFGLQAEGGVVPGVDFSEYGLEKEATWNGVFDATVFWRPVSFMKISVGYLLTSNFYESDLAVAGSRDDGPMAGLELQKNIGKVSAYVGGGYFRSDVDGAFIAAGIVF